MDLKTLSISELKPADYNPRIIDDEELKGLIESIKTFGQQENLIVNKDMTVVSGHQRLKAMQEIGITEAVCNVVDLDKHQEKKLNVLMNSPAISGRYNDGKLALILKELKLDDDYTSLRLDELAPLDLGVEEINEDDAPPLDDSEVISKVGEVYQLGSHRVMCGDSTKGDDIGILCAGVNPDMTFTDPPYGVDYSSRVDKNRRKPWGTILNDDLKDESLRDFLFDTCSKIPNPKYVCCNWQSVVDFMLALGKPNAFIVWDKGSIGLGAGFRNQHELILFYGKLKHNSETNVWAVSRDSSGSYNHPTQKPVAIPARAIKNSSKPGAIVLDLFLGSGSTLIACEQTGRICYGMELDPKYVDVIRKRYAKLIGKEEEWQKVTSAVPQ